MKKNQAKIALLITIVIFSLSCNGAQRLLLGISGIQGQVDSLTHVANPIEVSTGQTATPVPAGLLTQENPSLDDPADGSPDPETPAISTVSPTQADSRADSSPSDAALQQMTGVWTGTAQWLCNDQPVWSMTLDLQPGGVVTAILTIPGETSHQDGTWVLAGNTINMYFEYGFLIGNVSGNSMEGTFSDENCDGVWSAAKEY